MPTFQMLWNSHPTVTGDNTPCRTKGKANFANQCAIRMGVCLTKAGVKPANLGRIKFCWQHKRAQGHVLVAEQLANALAKRSIAGVGKRQKVNPADFAKSLAGKTGIIFFKDYWKRKGENFRHRSGDHIDLWNGSRLTDWTSWARIHLGITSRDWSDFAQSKEIWFWEVK